MKRTLVVSAITLLCASPAFAQTNQGQDQQNNQQVQKQQTQQEESQQQAQQQTETGQQEGQLRTTFVDTNGEEIGTATLHETPQGVLIKTEVNGLPSGMHGFHIHETGKCDAQGAFESAGSHYAPQGSEHGYESSGGLHAGDLPNQYVSQDGTLKADIFSHMTTISEGDAPLLDDDGSALVIHSGVDDYSSQPAGDSGDRIACAPITKEQQQAMQTGSEPEQQAMQSGSQQEQQTLQPDAQQEQQALQSDPQQEQTLQPDAQQEQQALQSDPQQETLQPDAQQEQQAMQSDPQQEQILQPDAQQDQQTAQTTGQPPAEQQDAAVVADAVYAGVSVNRLIDADLKDPQGNELGEVKDIVLDRDGNVSGVVVEGGGFLGFGESTFQIPWSEVSLIGDGEVGTSITEEAAEQQGLYDQPEEIQLQTNQFLATQLIGDTANVRDGQAYGQVSDVIIGQDGKVAAVLVDRDGNWGGGTYGYAYDNTASNDWDPNGDTYMLPFDSVQVAATVPEIDETRLDRQS